MDRLIALILPELARNVPAIILAAVAAASLWANARVVARRWILTELAIERLTAMVAGVPSALERVKAHDLELTQLRQELHDANLMARQYVTRSELIESIGSTGQKLHARIDAAEKEITRLDERSKRI